MLVTPARSAQGSPILRKALGQHHLVRPEACAPLLEFLRPAGETVVEIGPGGGLLTGELLATRAKRVVAIELDAPWARTLRERLPDPRLDVVIGDALDFDAGRLATRTLVAGNLPYGVATAIILRLLPRAAAQTVPRAAFLVQWEVGERLVAQPGSKAYGALSVLAAARADVESLGRVARGAFRPPPAVDGAFVGFTLREGPVSVAAWPEFARVVRLAFAQRRKMLRRSLASSWGLEVTDAILDDASIDGSRRAEQLNLDEFIAIFESQRRAQA